MHALSKFKTALRWSAAGALCALGVALALADPPETNPKGPGAKGPAAPGAGAKIPSPAGVSPKGPAPKGLGNSQNVNLDSSRFRFDKPLKSILYNPYTIDEVRKMWGNDKLTPDSMLTLHNKQQVTVDTYMKQLNQVEQVLAAHGRSTRNIPEGGYQMKLTNKSTPAQFKKQQATIATAHKQPAGTVKEAAKPTRADVAADKKTRDAFEASRRAHLVQALEKHRDKMSPADKQALDQFAKGKHTDFAITIPPTLLAVLKGDGLLDRVNFGPAYHKGWNFSFGSADLAEVDVVGDLILDNTVGPAGAVESMHAHGSLEADCFILDSSRSSPHKIVEILADMTSASSGQVLQASAKVFGEDLFTPINETINKGDILSKSGNHKIDVQVATGGISLIDVPTPVGDLSISLKYTIKAQGDFQFALNAKATAAGVSVNSSGTLGVSLIAFAGADLAILEVGVEGSPNLVSDTLSLAGSVGVGQDGGGPFLETTGSAHDTLKLLGGELDFVIKLDLGIFGSKDLFRVKLLSFHEFDPIDGFIFGPDDIKKPLQKQANPGPAFDAKKK